MPKYILSILASGQKYTIWNTSKPELHQAVKSVEIAGGANVANKLFVTPRGVVTPVTDAEYAVLKEVTAFNNHVKGGYLKVLDRNISDAKADKLGDKADVIDAGAPLTEDDFEGETFDGKNRKPPSHSDVAAGSASADDDDDDFDDEPDEDPEPQKEVKTPKRRGRPRKVKAE